jgi:hypothetical protein
MVIEILIILLTICSCFFIAIETLNITRFIVKIGLKNLPSISLFTNKLQFQTVNRIFHFFYCYKISI